jgi:hypothetical protein
MSLASGYGLSVSVANRGYGEEEGSDDDHPHHTTTGPGGKFNTQSICVFVVSTSARVPIPLRPLHEGRYLVHPVHLWVKRRMAWDDAP